jgi:hypothetical protein
MQELTDSSGNCHAEAATCHNAQSWNEQLGASGLGADESGGKKSDHRKSNDAPRRLSSSWGKCAYEWNKSARCKTDC